ncbi:uncharacterized protein LOC111329689 [Stylophora pistillata]|uniref:uncharacterized protein LOC111329689 n=1 Tax=Stylophora pistillata TaxID=50429 RepID=UPI000C04BE29|nr:uncharacterized protein LOC111329689 [Stylophora pistillata]
MEATGRSFYIRIIMWVSFLFTFTAYEPFWQMTIGYATLLKIKNSSGYEAMVCLSIFVGILGSVNWMILSSFIIYNILRDDPTFYVDTCILHLSVLVLCLITPLPYTAKYIWVNCRSSNPGPKYRSYMWYIKLFAPLSAIYTCFYFCWVLVGVMLNPIWGLTVALAICFTFASFTYVVYNYVNLKESLFDVNMQGYLRKKWVRSWLAVIFLTLVVIFAGQSFNERETADKLLQTVLLAALAYVISWLSWRSSNNRQTQPVLGGPFTDHSPSQSPPVNDAFNQLLQLVTDYSGQQPHSASDQRMPIIDETSAEIQSSSGGSSVHSQPSALSETLTEIVVDVHESPSSVTSQRTPSQLPLDDSLKVNYQTTAESQSLLSDSPDHQTQPNDSSMRNQETDEPRELQPLMFKETSV